MKRSHLWALALLALLVRVPTLFQIQSMLPVCSPWGPLPLWLQPWLDAHAAWAWPVLGGLGALADAGSAVFIARLVERRRLAERLLTPQRGSEGIASPGFWAGLAWALCPVSLYLVGSAGAWQSLSLLALLSGAWDLEYSRADISEKRAAWAFGAAISFSAWPLLVLPIGAAGLLSRRDRQRFYVRALALPLALALPWLFLVTPQEVAQAWLGAPSTLGVPGLLSALWSAAGAPQASLSPLFQGWTLLGALLMGGLALRFMQRSPALLPGLALGAWAWVLLSPSLQGPLLIAPLGLALLVPGGLGLRQWMACAPLLVLQDRLPVLRSLMLRQDDLNGAQRGLHLLWAALLLAWCFWAILEWARLSANHDRSHSAMDR